MKKALVTIIFATLAMQAGAQGIERQRTKLRAQEPAVRARVEVKEEPDAARAIATADKAPQKETVTGYCVNLFGGNSQSAGENARSVAAQFSEQFPNIKVRVEYKSPYFNVMAGDFAYKLDAIALCGKVLAHFPKAVVMQEVISVADIAEQLKSTGKENFANLLED